MRIVVTSFFRIIRWSIATRVFEHLCYKGALGISLLLFIITSSCSRAVEEPQQPDKGSRQSISFIVSLPQMQPLVLSPILREAVLAEEGEMAIVHLWLYQFDKNGLLLTAPQKIDDTHWSISSTSQRTFTIEVENTGEERRFVAIANVEILPQLQKGDPLSLLMNSPYPTAFEDGADGWSSLWRRGEKVFLPMTAETDLINLETVQQVKLDFIRSVARIDIVNRIDRLQLQQLTLHHVAATSPLLQGGSLLEAKFVNGVPLHGTLGKEMPKAFYLYEQKGQADREGAIKMQLKGLFRDVPFLTELALMRKEGTSLALLRNHRYQLFLGSEEKQLVIESIKDVAWDQVVYDAAMDLITLVPQDATTFVYNRSEGTLTLSSHEATTLTLHATTLLTAPQGWVYKSLAPWVTLSQMNDDFTLHIEANTSGKERHTKLLFGDQSVPSFFVKLMVVQPA